MNIYQRLRAALDRLRRPPPPTPANTNKLDWPKQDIGYDNFVTWNGLCPDCNGTKFYEGPQGGMSMNIECVECGCRLNACFALHLAHRISRHVGIKFGPRKVGDDDA